MSKGRVWVSIRGMFSHSINHEVDRSSICHLVGRWTIRQIPALRLRVSEAGEQGGEWRTIV